MLNTLTIFQALPARVKNASLHALYASATQTGGDPGLMIVSAGASVARFNGLNRWVATGTRWYRGAVLSIGDIIHLSSSGGDLKPVCGLTASGSFYALAVSRNETVTELPQNPSPRRL